MVSSRGIVDSVWVPKEFGSRTRDGICRFLCVWGGRSSGTPVCLSAEALFQGRFKVGNYLENNF